MSWDPKQYTLFREARRRPFFELLARVGATETTYLHVLPGEDAVLQWLLGTTLRPVLGALGPEEGAAFVDTLRPLLRQDYPALPYGTPFPFSRRFVIATPSLPGLAAGRAAVLPGKSRT